MANVEQGSQKTEEFRKAEVKRVIGWRKKNPGKYKALKQRYDKSEKGRAGRKRRYHENIEESRRQSRERVRRFRAKQQQQ